MADETITADTNSKQQILVVDDEPAIVEALQLVLEGAGYTVLTAGSAAECLDLINGKHCDLMLLDMMLPDRSGLEVLKDVGRINQNLPVVMLTAYGSIETAVEATRLGAANFLTKPWNNSKLLLEIKQTLERRDLEAENARLRSELARSSHSEQLIGQSEAISRVFGLIRQVAPTSSTVLISGESGTGKDIVAKAIHNASTRARHPFVTVNSGRIPDELLESTLFGHVKGAFAGATRDRRGCFEIADRGTVFLDEVGTLSLEAQAKLLRVIQEREFVRVGSNDPVRVDVRIVAATNANLDQAVKVGRFRQDLYYRINVIGIELPPLRQRMGDLSLFVDEFLTQFCHRENNHFLDDDGNSTLRFTAEAQGMLMAHDWPGNVRELRNVVERAVVLATKEELGPASLPMSLHGDRVRRRLAADKSELGHPPDASLAEMVEAFERRTITGELERHGYNQTETAKSLRVALSTLNQKIQRLGIDARRRRHQ